MTPDALEREHTLATAVSRLDLLRRKESFAVTRDELAADGVLPGPGVYRDQLRTDEALELLALGEVVTRKAAYGRQLTVRSARAAGASWTAIGAALGTSRQAAWEAHQRWLAASDAGPVETEPPQDDA
ncbi:hypothetical protein [Kineosporia sp. A_224]|uniref:hypothetical protein n=1 Tax=Kineosporia sp. A_224 TaxID=1962180 RepID=UPI000B4BC121|nr:hypothetical protein [Kineosporia sp. A_224]